MVTQVLQHFQFYDMERQDIRQNNYYFQTLQSLSLIQEIMSIQWHTDKTGQKQGSQDLCYK